MTKLDEYSRRIAHYIYDDLEPGDRVRFEAELEGNEELAEEYRRQVQAVQYLKTRTRLNEYFHDPDMEEADRLVDEFFKEKEAAESGSVKSPVNPARRKSLKYILYPLIAAAAIVGGVLIFNTSITRDLNDRLYKQYYAPWTDAGLISRGSESAFKTEFYEALNLYFAGDYLNSGSEFDKLAGLDPSHAESALFLSLSKMGAENYQESAELLESFLYRFDLYQPEAKWYLSLCYLKLDQPEKAIALLNDLADLDGKYGHDSQKMLQSLR
jgi:hypothetical protein